MSTLAKKLKNLKDYRTTIDPKTKEKVAFVSVLIMDAFSSSPQKAYAEIFREEISRLRKNPRSFIENVLAFEKKHAIKYKDENALKASIEKLVTFLKTCDSLPEFSYSEELHQAANEYCYFIRSSKYQNFYEEDEELFNIRLPKSKYISSTSTFIHLSHCTL